MLETVLIVIASLFGVVVMGIADDSIYFVFRFHTADPHWAANQGWLGRCGRAVCDCGASGPVRQGHLQPFRVDRFTDAR